MLNQSFPQTPGVYWFLNQPGSVIYVGKAKNLSQRLKSYRQADSLKTRQMLNQATALKYQSLDSELEALLVEAELIRLYQPLYNLRQKDDKSPLYIYITNHQYPQVKTGRLPQIQKLNLKKNNLFGPFPSGYQAKQVLNYVRHIFPFCNQSKAGKACFYYHLHLCPGACIKAISPKDYQQNINHLKLFLKGKKKSVVKKLLFQIKACSQKKDFEKAAILRDQLYQIKAITQAHPQPELNLPILQTDIYQSQANSLKQILIKYLHLPSNYPLNRLEGYDISNLQGQQATASMVVFINGQPRPDQYRRFKIRLLNTPNDTAMLKQAVSRRLKHTDWTNPNLMVIDGGKTQLNAVLSLTQGHIPTVSIAKHPDRLILKNPHLNQYFIVPLTDNLPAAKLIQRLRNESHRFAKAYHSKLHLKSFLG